jgi:hypothetical protein
VQTEIDILENEIIEQYPDILNILLSDQTTQKKIFWATENYSQKGESYSFNSEISPDLITGDNGSVIMPRVYKDKILQLSRSKEMAEVFTPSWICNAQNNIIDNVWFDRENVFNTEILLEDGSKTWEVNNEKISYPKGKTWKDYISDTRLEITCGEAPYIVSRYDTTTGDFISIEKRIGILDRKLRVINENVDAPEEWFDASMIAYQNTYAFEWQGDSLLLAREAMLLTFIENFTHKFSEDPSLKSIESIANIISWNVWQMDGLKGVVPNSCVDKIIETKDLFDSKTEIIKCKGCESQNILLHEHGTYCKIMDWNQGKPILFIHLLKK